MAAKKSNSNATTLNVVFVIAIAVGIWLTIMGVLSNEVDSWRSFLLASGLVLIVTGTIGFQKK